MAGYGSDEGLQTWLDSFGYEIPSGSSSPAVLRQRGSQYVDGLYGSKFPGTPTGGIEQERAWPRTDVEIYGAAVSSSAIPTAVEHASYAAALYEAENPGGLAVAITAAGVVKREKVGPIEVEYQAASGGSATQAVTPLLSMVEGLLAPFILSSVPYIALV
jgi:hypothetical protein